ncbi:MAG: hypothetical protein OEZ43_20515 [Gammaproteobacteria bacterium]|nr:hypothetical protein [Gammaproteobacteria bacterium]
MNDLVNFMDKWQTLAGSFLGGVFALLVAMYVAWNAKNRDEIVSAMVIVPDLLHIFAARSRIAEIAASKRVPKAKWDLLYATLLVKQKPKLSPMYTMSMSRILPVNISLATHLSMIDKIYPILCERIDEIKEYLNVLDSTDKLPVSIDVFNGKIRNISNDMKLVSKHAFCANELIHKLILSKIAMWYRFVYLVRVPSAKDKCYTLVKTGRT